MLSVCEQPFSFVSRTMVPRPFNRRNQVWSHMRVVDGQDYLAMREGAVRAIIESKK